MSNPNVVSGGLVISMRPQVSVELTIHGEIVITTATVGNDFNSVEVNDVTFPLDCAKEIAEAILALAGEPTGEARRDMLRTEELMRGAI